MNDLIVYEWNSGSTPHPYHYEIRIIFKPDGSGTLEWWPDKHSYNIPPMRKWAFKVSRIIMDKLNLKIEAALRQTIPDETVGELKIGGPMESLNIQHVDQGRQVSTTSELVSTVRSAVPAEFWAELNTERDQYIDRTLTGASPNDD